MLDLIRSLLATGSGPSVEEKIYEQDCTEFRALNAIFWQIPLIVMTLNGGLWFAVANLELTSRGQSLILWFSVLVNLGFIIALFRLRLIMDRLLKRIRRFEGAYGDAPQGSFIVISAFLAMLGLASLGAGMAAIDPTSVLKPKSANATVLVCRQDQGATAQSPMACRLAR